MMRLPLAQVLIAHDSGEWGEDPDGDDVIRVIRVADIRPDYSISWDTAPLRTLTPKKRATKILEEGDIVVVKASGSAERIVSGRAALVRNLNSREFSFANFLLRLRVDRKKCLPEYLVYFLNSPFVKSEIRKIVGSTTYPNLKIPDYLKLLVPVVPLEKQQRVVDFLSRAEGIVRLRREAQKKAAEIIPALFLDMFGDPATNAKGFVSTRLADIAEVVSGITKGRKLNGRAARPVPYLTVC